MNQAEKKTKKKKRKLSLSLPLSLSQSLYLRKGRNSSKSTIKNKGERRLRPGRGLRKVQFKGRLLW